MCSKSPFALNANWCNQITFELNVTKVPDAGRCRVPDLENGDGSDVVKRRLP